MLKSLNARGAARASQLGLWALLGLSGLLAACGSGGDDAPQEEPAAFVATPKNATSAVLVGEFLFKDPALSASGRVACSTCHEGKFGHADQPGGGLPKGGPAVTLSGMRSSPTARYLNTGFAFRLDGTGKPFGGFTWDGRADTRRQQAQDPFFDSVEMALPGSPKQPAELLKLVRAASYFKDLKALYEPDQLDTDAKLFKRVSELLEIYQRDDVDYNLFDSRFDHSLAGGAALSASEARGLAIFRDPARGNCASCHTADGNKPVFTDFGYAALGVPRNHTGPKNADPAFFDLGLCARNKEVDPQVKGVARYCGMFKTPTLRNITRSAPYFHNGAITSLEDAVRFHFTRDTHPARWYRKADGSADIAYNDLPAAYRANLSSGQPFAATWVPGDADMADLMAFLATLDDADQTEPLK